jgi:hypothetical protein
MRYCTCDYYKVGGGLVRVKGLGRGGRWYSKGFFPFTTVDTEYRFQTRAKPLLFFLNVFHKSTLFHGRKGLKNRVMITIFLNDRFIIFYTPVIVNHI